MIMQLKGLKKQYKKQLVLKGIDIQVDTPEIIALVGPNGSGKTTLLNCMTNLISFNEGQIELLGKKHTDSSLFYDVSFLQDNRILYEHLTGYDHLQFICKVQKLPRGEIKAVAERVGMANYLKKRVRNYSLGMKQHLLLAMVIINKPKLLLMDEPLNGLDPTSAINMRRILLELYEEGTTIFISSHNLDEIDRLTKTIYFMKDGALLKESLKDYFMKEYVITVDNLEYAKKILRDKNIPFVTKGKHQLGINETSIEVQGFIDHLNKNGIVIKDIEIEKIGAEKRYRELFEQEQKL